MKNARVLAVNLKEGDVIEGKRINHTPIIHSVKRATTVNFFVSNHGKPEPMQIDGSTAVVIKRPIYNLTRKPKAKVRAKDGTVVAAMEAPAVVDPLLTLIEQSM